MGEPGLMVDRRRQHRPAPGDRSRRDICRKARAAAGLIRMEIQAAIAAFHDVQHAIGTAAPEIAVHVVDRGHGPGQQCRFCSHGGPLVRCTPDPWRIKTSPAMVARCTTSAMDPSETNYADPKP